MKLLSAAFMFATGCFGGGATALLPGETATEPAVVTSKCAGLPMDDYQLGESMTLEADTLRVSVSYGGGCEEHAFAACWNGVITKTNPAALTLTLAHDANDDACDAFITRDLFIDISELPDTFGSPERANATSIRLVEGAN